MRPTGLPRLLSGGHEPHLLAGLRALLPLIHRLGPLIASTPPDDMSSGRGVNVALDERRGRCDAVARGLASVKSDLAAAVLRYSGGAAAALIRACGAAIADVIDTRCGYAAPA